MSSDLAHDRVLTPANGLVLVIHDCAGTGRRVRSKVTGKTRDGRDHNDNPELSPLFARSDTGFHDRASDHIVYRRLVLSGSGDEELVFDVDEMLRITDDVDISILDAVLDQNATAPVGATADDLSVRRALVPTGLRAQRLEWVLHIISARELRALHGHEVFIIAGTALKHQPVHVMIPLVLVTLDKVPPEHKMFRNVVYGVAGQAHANVMPWHSAILGLGQLVLLPLPDVLEIHDAVVVELLAGEELVGHVGRMDIGQRMLIGVPSAKAQVNTADEGQGVIDDNELFVMRLTQSACLAHCPKHTYKSLTQ